MSINIMWSKQEIMENIQCFLSIIQFQSYHHALTLPARLKLILPTVHSNAYFIVSRETVWQPQTLHTTPTNITSACVDNEPRQPGLQTGHINTHIFVLSMSVCLPVCLHLIMCLLLVWMYGTFMCLSFLYVCLLAG